MSSDKSYIGIDPGKSGAVALLRPGLPPEVCKTPTLALTSTKRGYYPALMVGLLREHLSHGPALVVIETTSTRPGEGRVSAHTIGWGAGLWTGMLVGIDAAFIPVDPASWKAVMLKGMPKADSPQARKTQSVLVAGRIFPSTDLRGPKGGLQDGFADALLLAEYGRRMGL